MASVFTITGQKRAERLKQCRIGLKAFTGVYRFSSRIGSILPIGFRIFSSTVTTSSGCTSLSARGYYEVEERMYHAVMELVRFFYEDCECLDQKAWRDEVDEEDGSIWHGYRYGDRSDTCLFPEYKGKYIIDIIEEIHDWYTKGYDLFMKAYEYAGWKLAPHRNIIARDLKRIRKECRHNKELSMQHHSE